MSKTLLPDYKVLINLFATLFNRMISELKSSFQIFGRNSYNDEVERLEDILRVVQMVH